MVIRFITNSLIKRAEKNDIMLLSSYRRKETRYYELTSPWQFETQLTMAWESTGHIILFVHLLSFYTTMIDTDWHIFTKGVRDVGKKAGDAC